MENETIMIDGVRYYADRPNSCRGCFFWKNRKAGCSLKKENCYYLAESPKKTSPCLGCCYGPCVSFCNKTYKNHTDPSFLPERESKRSDGYAQYKSYVK